VTGSRAFDCLAQSFSLGISELALLCDALHALPPGDDSADREAIGDAQGNLEYLPDLELALEVVASETPTEVSPLVE
jgi:hypothetical protein